MPDYAHSSAALSDDGVYRYELVRMWDPAKPTLGFCMLNPSTADGLVDDPTIKKCVGFAERNDCGGIRAVNAFAYRATDPKDLLRARDEGVDVVGPNNDEVLASFFGDPWDLPVVAWGANLRAERLEQIAQIPGAEWARCLGVTKSGMPRHPLMLAYDTPLERYVWPYEWVNSSKSQPVMGSDRSPEQPEGARMTAIGESLADAKEAITCLLYGKEGSTKTTSALMLAKLGHVVAIDAEGGMKPTALKARGVPIENVQIWPPNGNAGHISFETLENEVYVPLRTALEDARAKGEPDPVIGIVVDSFSELAQILTKQAATESAARDAAKGKQRARFQINVEDYGTQTQMIRQLLRMFRDLGVHLFITSLERRDQDDDGFVHYGPALGPAAATDTAGMVDIVIWTRSEEIGPNATLFYTGITRPLERHRAKDRYGKLPVKMVEPTADRVIAYVTGELTKSNDPRHKAAITAARPVDAAPAPA